MRRRDFLKSTGAAASAAATAGLAAAPADAAALSKPAIATGRRVLRLATSAGDDAGRGAGRGLAPFIRRVASATDDRLQIELVPAKAATGAELTFDVAGHFEMLHPAFTFFAGMPTGRDLDATAFAAWLGVGGGQGLWDDLAADHGMKILAAGHSGASRGLWLRVARPTNALAGLHVAAPDCARAILAAVGARTADPAAVGAPDAVEWLGGATPFGYEPAHPNDAILQPGLFAGGRARWLAISRPAWDRFSASDRAVLEACACEAWMTALAEAAAEAEMRRVVAAARGFESQPLAPATRTALAAAVADTVADWANTDALARRIAASYEAHRRSASPQSTIAQV